MKTLLAGVCVAALLVAGAFAFAPRVEIVTEIDIDAPPATVWSVLADLPGHREWNPFIVSMEGELVEGATLVNTLRPAGGSEMTFRPTVLTVTPERELRWLGRFLMPRIVDGEHYFLLQEREGGTRLVHGERFCGVAFWFMDAEQFRADFEAMNTALKARAETGRADGPRIRSRPSSSGARAS